MLDEPFHSGELAVQEKTGERDRAILNSRAIGSIIPPGARAFVAVQRYCVVGSVSPAGSVWASFVTGEPGFASTDAAGSSVTLRLPELRGSQVPPLSEVQAGDHLGALFIDLATRRRLRVNGVVRELTTSSLQLQVGEAFPNCPKYIQRRNAAPVLGANPSQTFLQGETLTTELVDWIRNADTFFVASADSNGRVDVSHRGGNSGFVRVEDGILRVPDYPGNSMFGTLGNFTVNPHGGLAFVDFGRNLQLQVTGDVQLELERGEQAGETGGTGRWWAFRPKAWIVSNLRPSLDWALIDSSPYNPQ